MKKRTLLLLLSLLPLSMTAQQKFLLRGQVVDAANDSPVSFATTALLRDSTAVAAVAADAQGRFELSAEAAGDYRLQITMVGYNPETQPVTLRTAATDAGTIRLRQGVDIDQVTVTIQKPLVTADAEKTTYSVEDDPQAASSTLEEILRKVPQLTIDAEGNVKLNGQSDFKVLVNGRSSAMFKNFKDVIRSMPASQIKKIEVITEPSMKYDAEGAGGIINIINRAEDILGRAPDYVFAGFHLYNPSLGQSEPRALVDAVGERLRARKATRYVTGHCTGDDAYAWLRQTLGDRLAYMATGTTFTI